MVQDPSTLTEPPAVTPSAGAGLGSETDANGLVIRSRFAPVENFKLPLPLMVTTTPGGIAPRSSASAGITNSPIERRIASVTVSASGPREKGRYDWMSRLPPEDRPKAREPEAALTPRSIAAFNPRRT